MRYDSPPRILGVVPAKAASRRLKRKNIRNLGGKPLLGWAAEAALATGRFDRLVVSTEDEEVAAIAERHGLEVPFMRPPELAVDPAEADEVALHAIEAMDEQGEQFDVVTIMLPTCPFRTTGDIVAALDLFLARNEPNLMSLSEFTHTAFAAMRVDPDGLASPLFPDLFGLSRREHPVAYRPNGGVHVLDVAWFRETRSYRRGPIIGFVMPRDRSVDIDTEGDLRLAESMLAGQQ